MTPEEKQAMIQFFGMMHAQGKRTDEMVVNRSNHLNPISNTIQNELGNLLRREVVQAPPQPVQPTQQLTQPVDVNEAIKELEQIEHINNTHTNPVVVPVAPIQQNNYSNTDIIAEELKKINLSLQEIVSLLKQKNVKPKKIINKKQS